MPTQLREKTLRARELRQNQTAYEAALWKLLRSHQMNGYHWRRQYPIGPYFADFARTKAKLIVELDGRSHDDREKVDKIRDSALKQRGWTTLRILNTDLMQNPEGVWLTIARLLNFDVENEE